ncbi:MAG: AzlC family ABC transporter permease [Pseudomonadota bacterium]
MTTFPDPALTTPAERGWRAAFGDGFRVALTLPGLILFSSFVGYGALTNALGFRVDEALFTTVFIWALPSQVVLVQALASDVALIAAAIAVSLSACRLMPMVVAILPHLRPSGEQGRWAPIEFLLAHFVAITVWIETFRALPALSLADRRGFLLGAGVGLMSMSTLATGLGHQLADTLPPLMSGALLFMTPIYFALTLTAGARERLDQWAIGAGLVLGPVFAYSGLGLDLLWTGIVGGTLVYVLDRLVPGAGPPRAGGPAHD